MIDDMVNFFSQADASEFTQSQRESIVDILILFMLIDKAIKPEEKTVLANVIAVIGWNGSKPYEQYEQDTIMDIMKQISDIGSVEKFLDDRISEMNDVELLRKVYFLCDNMINADSVIHERELKILRMTQDKVRAKIE